MYTVVCFLLISNIERIPGIFGIKPKYLVYSNLLLTSCGYWTWSIKLLTPISRENNIENLQSLCGKIERIYTINILKFKFVLYFLPNTKIWVGTNYISIHDVFMMYMNYNLNYIEIFSSFKRSLDLLFVLSLKNVPNIRVYGQWLARTIGLILMYLYIYI